MPTWLQNQDKLDSFYPYARILEPATELFERPSKSSPVVKSVWQNAVLPIIDQSDAPQTGENGWYFLAGLGYLPTDAVQPVEYAPQLPNENISRQGSLAEVCVPYTTAYFRPEISSQVLYRYYFGSTHWVNKLIYDREGQAWYRIKDDKFPKYERWVKASRLRILTPEALAPISSDIPTEEKNILVELDKQTVTAFEFGLPVFSAPISSGEVSVNTNYQTPTGVFRVGLKRPSQHMLPWDTTFGDYDLPGVPWVSYFTNQAHAFHGAFWHNGFGTPRSHGCINLKPDDARWIYRWTTPVVQPHDDMEYAESGGTLVEVL